ncbi:PD40 domain-containing protein [Prevotella sp. OH937_COT-195]|uniref:PD40 domain-containing protein n=1 Tax=Prevotella sp. OH937_COT-195 TaxID=2491051 RepID=UPI000F64F505|nr:PD40 domain-containing protein [Prevotella sp. OH937_COT-195]RRD02198.1 hypothetical protein EII32_03900 [Prevotella sp. OH937_COT-195]
MRILIVVLSLLIVVPSMAQKGKKRPKSRKTIVDNNKPTVAELMFENMLSSIRKVVIIDSVVVAKDEFLSRIPLSPESGKLEDNGQGASFRNDFIDKKYFSRRDTAGFSKIYVSDRLAGQWTEPQELSTIGNADYPFLMADGTTLYFAGKGDASLGGYDIFVTRYDSEDGSLLEPQNIGLPFNSFDNDYLYAEDETDSIAWLVTDRNQPEGMVCIYTILPNGSRSYDISELSDERLRGLARISSIKDTWGDMAERNAALKRLAHNDGNGNGAENGNSISFIVNDKLTYTSVNQFKSPSSTSEFKRLQIIVRELGDDDRILKELRERYASASRSARIKMSDEIIKLEQKIMKREKEKRVLEKSIRNTENILTK